MNAAYGSLADFLEKFAPSFDVQNVAKAIDTAVAIIDRYEKVTAADMTFGDVSRDLLAQRVHQLFRITIGPRLDAHFWWELQFYEWAKQKKLLAISRFEVRRENERPTPFSDEELADFFIKNERDVLRRLMREANRTDTIELTDPIGSRASNDLT